VAAASVAPAVETTTVAPAAVGATTMEPTAVRPTAVEEDMGARVPRRSCIQPVSRMGRRMPGEASAISVGKVATVHASRMKMINGRMTAISIYDGSTVGDERLVVIFNPAMMPIASPVVPTPTVASK
jgi:hypothetical protein